MTVLVADDDAATRLLLRRVLRGQFGCDVVEAADGGPAIEALASRAVDLVLLDLGMPQVDGLNVLRALRGSPATSSLPVIVLTGETSVEVVREVASLGIADYMVKPLSVELVASRLIRLFPELDRQGVSTFSGR